MPNHPKRHHYLPESYLKRFTREKALWVYDIEKKQLRHHTPHDRGKRVQYAQSNIVMTRKLSELAKWSEAEIRARGEALAAMATKIWPGPVDIFKEYV